MFRDHLLRFALVLLLGLMLLGSTGCCVADLFEEDDDTTELTD